MALSFVARRFSSLRNLYIPLIVIGLLLVPFAMYEVYYVEGREAYLRDRSFRLLTSVGNQIDGLINAEADKLRAAGGVFDSSNKDRDAEYRRLWANEVFQESSFNSSWDPRKDKLQQPNGYDRDGFVSLEVAELQTSFSISLAYSQHSRGVPLIKETRRLNSDLRRRIDQLTQDFFDEVLIADEHGKVLFQSKNIGIQVYRVDALFRRPDDKNSSVAPAPANDSGSSSGTAQTELVSSPVSFWPATQASWEQDTTLAGTSYKLFIQPVRIAVRRRQAERPGDGSLNLLVCGLWSSDRWHNQSFELPYTNVTWVALLLLTVFFFAWPFVKVTYMSPKEPFRPRDGWYMMLSAICATVLVTIMLANSYYQNYKSSLTQHDLQTLAGDIQSHFDKELHLYFSDFEHLISHPEFLNSAQHLNDWAPTRLTVDCKTEQDGFHQFDQAFYVDASGNQRIKLLVKGAITPQTNIANIALFDALQKGQLVKLNLPPPASSDSGQSDTDGSSSTPNHRSSTSQDEYQIQMMRSPNTGEFQMLIAKQYPFGLDPEKLPNGLQVLGNKAVFVLVARPTTLVNPILPSGFGFAVVDENGLVQLHSDSIRNLEENFFQECGRDPYLIASAVAGKTEFHTINYMGEPKSAYITPLTGLSINPLTLIVFRSSGLDDIGHLAVVLFCAVLLGIPACLLLLIALIDLLRGRRSPPLFLWPKPEYTRSYLYLFLTNCVYTGIFVECLFAMPSRMPGALIMEAAAVTAGTLIVSALWFRNPTDSFPLPKILQKLLRVESAESPQLVVITTAIVLIFSPVLFFFIFKASGNGGELSWWQFVPVAYGVLAIFGAFYVPRVSKRFFHGAYTAAAVSVLLAIAVVPSVALFRASWETVDNLEFRYSQIALYKALLDQEETIKNDYPTLTDDQRRDFIKERWARGRYLDALFEDQPIPKDDPTKLEQALVNSSSHYVPARRLGAYILEADRKRMDNAHWQQIDAMMHSVDQMGSESGKQRFIWPPPWWLVFVHWTVLIVLFAWIYHLVKKLFLTDSHPAPALPKAHWKSAAGIMSPHIVMGHSRSRKTTKLRCIADLPSLDLRVALNEGTSFNPWPAPTRIVALDHFEFNIDDPDYNLRRLELVEKLLYVYKYTLIIISTLDPLYYLQEGGPSILTKLTDPAAATTETGKLLDRWSRALSKFKKVELCDDSAKDFEAVERVAAGGDPMLNTGPWQPNEIREYLTKLNKVIVIARGAETQPKLNNLKSLMNASCVIQNESSAQDALDTLEQLIEDSPGSCIIFSSIDLWAYATNERNSQTMAPEIQERWKDALDKFEKLDITTPAQVQFARLIKEECDATAYLRRIGAALFDEFVAECEPNTFPEKERLVDILLDRVDSYYRVLWSSFTENERLVLYQLSHDGWANPLNRAAIQQLQRKEFVTKTIPYKVMNESFRRFALITTDEFEIAKWQKQEAQSSWHSFRIGLITMFIVLAAWLLYAQKDLFQLSIGYIVTLGGAVTAVLNFLGAFKSKSTEVKK